MELQLSDWSDKREVLLSVGAENAHDIHALCNDVAAMIFPSAIHPPTEAALNAVTVKLVAVVSDIEKRVQNEVVDADHRAAETWPLLARSGFLREPELIDFALARVAEDRLQSQIETSSAQLPSTLLIHENTLVAEAAQNLLAADSLHRRTPGQSYLALRPELLHQLCWRIVAAIEVASGQRNALVLTRARALLADYDEAQTAQVAAGKIVHLASAGFTDELMDPELAGLQLYAANLASMLNIDHDHVLRLIDSNSSAPLAVMLRAVSCEPEQAMASIYFFKGFSLTPRDVDMFDRDYERLAPEDARSEIERWGNGRTQYLALRQAA